MTQRDRPDFLTFTVDELLEWDQLLYGVSVESRLSDGRRRRHDPLDVILLPGTSLVTVRGERVGDAVLRMRVVSDAHAATDPGR